MDTEEDEAFEGRKLAEQGNTDAKLFVPEDDEDQKEPPEESPSEDEAAGDHDPEGDAAA